MHSGYLCCLHPTLFNFILRKADVVRAIGDFGPNASVEQLMVRVLEYVSHFGNELFDDTLLPGIKIVYNHAHSSHLAAYKELLLETGLDMIDAFTPPPVGDLSVAEARKAWQERMVISINFPETIFWSGPEETKKYTLDLLKQDPAGLWIITTTEMGISMLSDDKTEQAYKSGMRAIMDAIDEYCA